MLPPKLQEIKDKAGTLVDADLVGADLSGADLRAVNLENANLRYATLTGADLRRAILRGANLRHAVLRESDLREADLSRADVGQADFGGSRIGRTRMNGIKLAGVVGVAKKTFFTDDDIALISDRTDVEFDTDRLAFNDNGLRLEFSIAKAIRIFDFVDGQDPDMTLIGTVRTPSELNRLNARITRHGLVLGEAFYAIITGYLATPQSRVTEDLLLGKKPGKSGVADATSDADMMAKFLSSDS